MIDQAINTHCCEGLSLVTIHWPKCFSLSDHCLSCLCSVLAYRIENLGIPVWKTSLFDWVIGGGIPSYISLRHPQKWHFLVGCVQLEVTCVSCVFIDYCGIPSCEALLLCSLHLSCFCWLFSDQVWLSDHWVPCCVVLEGKWAKLQTDLHPETKAKNGQEFNQVFLPLVRAKWGGGLEGVSVCSWAKGLVEA